MGAGCCAVGSGRCRWTSAVPVATGVWGWGLRGFAAACARCTPLPPLANETLPACLPPAPLPALQERVRKDITEWLRYLRNSIGFDGWRFDYVKVGTAWLPCMSACLLATPGCPPTRLPALRVCLPAPGRFETPSHAPAAADCSRAPMPAASPPDLTPRAVAASAACRRCCLLCALQGYEGRWINEYVDATVPLMAFGEYWDTCSYTGGRAAGGGPGRRPGGVDRGPWEQQGKQPLRGAALRACGTSLTACCRPVRTAHR